MFRGTSSSSSGSSLCASSRATSRSLKTAAPRTLWCYARALYHDDSATLDDLREAVTTLEETERTARRVLGRAHPIVVAMEQSLRNARAALRARETPEQLAQDAFRTARAKLAQERAELAKTLADASARPPK
jgi:hypothetical protein